MAQRERITIPQVKGNPLDTLSLYLYKSCQCPLAKDHPGTHLRSDRVGAVSCYEDPWHHGEPWDVSERGRQEGLVLRAGPMLAGLQGDSGEWTGNYQNLGKFCNYINFDFVVRRKEAGLELPLNKLSFLLAVEGISWPFWQLHGIYFYPCLGIITEWSFSFCFFVFFFL